MSTKPKKTPGTNIRSPSDHVLPKRIATSSREFRGIANEGEFSYNFRKFCIECNTSIIPNVKLVLGDDMHQMTTRSRSTVSNRASELLAAVPKKVENVSASVPEVLAIQDDATTGVVEVVLKQFQVDKNMLLALTKTLKAGACIRILRLEFCNLSSKEIMALSVILRIMDTIIEVSVDGNPNKYQNFFLLLKETKLLTLSLRFCKIDPNGVKRIADCINSFSTYVTLTRLNLSSNFLGDEGVAHLATALRVNRSLLILNLADNQITDKGCEIIAETLQAFPLNESEIKVRRQRTFAYLRRKQELMETMAMSKSKTTVSGSTNSKKSKDSIKKKESKIKRKTKGSEMSSAASSNIVVSHKKSQTSRSEFDRMNFVCEGVLPPDVHPFVKDTQLINREWHCIGNNKLASLNLAYNKITQTGLRILTDMLNYQANHFMLPDIGIIRLVLEGNEASNCCSEMNKIFDVIHHKSDSRRSSLNFKNKSASSLQ